jgi:hypothetical protein
MFLLRIFGLLALCLSLNIAIASDKAFHTLSNLTWEQSLLLAERPSPIRRGIKCKAPNVWTLNISCEVQSFCYVAPKEVKLWQPEKPLGQNSLLVIKNKTTHQKVKLHWQAGQLSLSWPVDKMPIESDVEYLIKITSKDGHSSYHFKTLHQIPADKKTDAEKAAWMEKNGCTDQAEMLLPSQS